MDDVGFRRAGLDDAEVLAATVGEGFASYRAWAHASWRPPDPRLELRGIRERLKRPDAWCTLAVARGGTAVGHVALLDASDRELPHRPIEGRAHLWMLFVRREWWGTGLAVRLLGMAVDEARERGARDMRLYTPAGQARARAFYEREGWAAAGAPWLEPLLELELIEYRRGL